jgi:uncharacterized delta-60 repeat protein
MNDFTATNARSRAARVSLVAVLLFCLLALALPANTRPAEAFGTVTGWLRLPGAETIAFHKLALRPGGGYLLLGARGDNVWLMGLTAEGKLDGGFGNGGEAGVDFGGRDVAGALAFTPDGKIVVAGTSNDDFVAARLNANGTLDRSFGNNGITARVNFDSASVGSARSNEGAYAVLVQPDGKIVVGGTSRTCGVFSCGESGLALVRFTAAGQLDTSFANKGKRLTLFDSNRFLVGSAGRITQLLRLRDGKILAIGEADIVNGVFRLVAARYDASGNLDKSFDGDGKASYKDLYIPNDAVELPDGKILILTYDRILRLLPNSEPDAGFGSKGVASTRFANLTIFGSRLAPQPDGRMQVLGNGHFPSGEMAALSSRFSASGALDKSFGNGLGYVAYLVPNGSTFNETRDGLVEPSGRTILLVQDRFNPEYQPNAIEYLLRLKADGSAEPAGSQAPPPGASFAVDDSYRTMQQRQLIVGRPGVLANDLLPNNRPLSAQLVNPPLNGTLDLRQDGSFVYTPRGNFIGSDRFSYQASDTLGAKQSAVVKISVAPPGNTQPVASSVGYDMLQDAPLEVAAPGVLTNGGDAEGQPLFAELVEGPQHGRLELRADGGYRYTPDAGFVGTDFFFFRASDDSDASETLTVTLRVAEAGRNVPPIAVGDRYLVARDTPLAVPAPGLLENDQDVNGDALGVEVVNPPLSGTLTLDPQGSFVYTPAAGFVGEDRFTYALSDAVSTKQALVRISVVETLAENPPHDDPTLELPTQETPTPTPAPEPGEPTPTPSPQPGEPTPAPTPAPSPSPGERRTRLPLVLG